MNNFKMRIDRSLDNILAFLGAFDESYNNGNMDNFSKEKKDRIISDMDKIDTLLFCLTDVTGASPFIDDDEVVGNGQNT